MKVEGSWLARGLLLLRLLSLQRSPFTCLLFIHDQVVETIVALLAKAKGKAVANILKLEKTPSFSSKKKGIVIE